MIISREESHRGIPTTFVKTEEAQVFAFFLKLVIIRILIGKETLVIGIITLEIITREIMIVCCVLIVV